MPAPYCFRLLDVRYDGDEPAVIAPTSARCVGSACAAWQWRDFNTKGQRCGGCGLVANGQSFPDPAQPQTPHPRTEKPT